MEISELVFGGFGWSKKDSRWSLQIGLRFLGFVFSLGNEWVVFWKIKELGVIELVDSPHLNGI